MNTIKVVPNAAFSNTFNNSKRRLWLSYKVLQSSRVYGLMQILFLSQKSFSDISKN